MDITQIKARLTNLNAKNTPKTGGEKKDIFFKPIVGKQTIRVVPSKFNKDNPFKEIYFHYGIGSKTLLSPINFNEKDPIVDFAAQLRKSKEREDWVLAKKLDPKMRVFIPIVVRGEEDKGVKLWGFGKEMYMAFLNLADNEDIGDYTDIIHGKDIIITTIGKESTGTDYNKSTIMPRMKETPLSDDKELVKRLLEDQINPLDAFKKYSFQEMKDMLQEHLSASEVEEDDEEETPVAVKTKVTKGDKFDALFEEKE